MKPPFAFLALTLITLTGAVMWRGRARWVYAQEKRVKIYSPLVPVPIPPMEPDRPPETFQALKYAEIADKNLFSKDRNPNVVIDSPKPADVRPMPSLPVVYGVLGLPSGTKAIMAVKSGEPSRPVRAGDTVGEFKIMALDIRNVTFDWNGQQISRPVEELIDRSATSQSAPNSPPPAAPIPLPQLASGGLATVNSAQNLSNSNSNSVNNPKLGKELGTPGSSVRGCVPGDNSPAGTIVDGYRKQVAPGPFGIGTQCSWTSAK